VHEGCGSEQLDWERKRGKRRVDGGGSVSRNTLTWFGLVASHASVSTFAPTPEYARQNPCIDSISPVTLLYVKVFPDGSEQPHTVTMPPKKFSMQHGGLRARARVRTDHVHVRCEYDELAPCTQCTSVEHVVAV
jgi:hypothetical protein